MAASLHGTPRHARAAGAHDGTTPADVLAKLELSSKSDETEEDGPPLYSWGRWQLYECVMAPLVYCQVSECRLCKSKDLDDILDLGVQALASRFPRLGDPDPPEAPLALCRCTRCGLVQLRHSVIPGELYTYGYGYKSGTNATMRGHLTDLVPWVERRCPLKSGDIVVDIGCNDGTVLKAYGTPGLRRFGIDPIAGKFMDQYPNDIRLHEGFFSTESYRAGCGREMAKVMTSIAMFYDLEAPADFAIAVKTALAPDGIWVMEQSYLPAMLQTNSYDTVCHEHLEYYALRQIEWLAEASGLRVFDVELNAANGGSFRVALCHRDGPYQSRHDRLGEMHRREQDMALCTRAPYDAFKHRIEKLRDDLVTLVTEECKRGKTFYLYGASTKGNTLLQYCGLGADKIVAAAERNPEKWGRRTPRTNIPILSEAECRAARPDYFLVLPWHFHSEFVARESEFRRGGGKLVFPLPEIEIL